MVCDLHRCNNDRRSYLLYIDVATGMGLGAWNAHQSMATMLMALLASGLMEFSSQWRCTGRSADDRGAIVLCSRTTTDLETT